jgi:hypothetical protein
MKPLFLTLALAAAWLVPAASAPAQYTFRYNSDFRGAPGVNTQGFAAPVAAPRSGFVPYSPNFYPYGNPYFIQDPANGFMTGLASVVDAQGNYHIQYQQARGIREDVKTKEIDNRRRLFDELRYEQEMTPSAEQLRMEAIMVANRRALNDPPQSEIRAGVSLNNLLRDIMRIESTYQVQGSPVPIAPDVMSRINFTTSTTSGGIGVFRDGGKLLWPIPLRAAQFDEQRKAIDQLAMEAVSQVRSGEITPEVVNGLTKNADDLRQNLRKSVRDMPPGDYMAARRYVEKIQDSVRAIQDPSAANFFNGKFRLQASNVGELVSQMKTSGLTFAPAMAGDDAAYTALHRALVTYNLSLSRYQTR